MSPLLSTLRNRLPLITNRPGLTAIINITSRRGLTIMSTGRFLCPSFAVHLHLSQKAINNITSASVGGFGARIPKHGYMRSNSQLAESASGTATAEMKLEDYHRLADTAMERMESAMEDYMEEHEEVDVEYSAGVLTMFHKNGTYVINKQPPSRQIWLSSPVTGPKRYDYDTTLADWVCRRDGSTLLELLRGEIGLSITNLMEQLDGR